MAELRVRLTRALGVSAIVVAASLPGSSSARGDTARLCVNAMAAEDVLAAAPRLAFACWKSFSVYGEPLRFEARDIGYTPVLVWRRDRDTPARMARLTEAYGAGRIHLPRGADLDDLLDAVSLARLRERILEDRARFPDGTLFLLGIEPGYAPADDRSPEAIAEDARTLRAMLDGFGRGYRLGLGGISTQRTPWVREAYSGRDGLAQLDAILDAAHDVHFDAFTVHPYPSDPAAPDASETLDQVRSFREALAGRGLRDRPVLVGEIGTPFAATPPDAAIRFAEEVLPLLLSATDAETGHPGDGNRLVQRIDWMMLRPPDFFVPGISDNPALDLSRSALIGSDGAPSRVGRRWQQVFPGPVRRDDRR